MEAFQRTLKQFVELYQSMSASQRISLIALPLMVVAALGYVMFNSRTSSYVPVSYGKVFTSRELENAEQSLIEAGLSDYRRQGRQLQVPMSDLDRANDSLLKAGALPDDWAAEIQKQIDSSSWFEGSQQRTDRMEFARNQVIARMIEASDDIERATVLVAPSMRRSPFRTDQKPAVTATVGVLPRAGRQLTLSHIQSIRAAVASAIPDLQPQDVVVMDQSTNLALSEPKGSEALDARVLTLIAQFTRMYHRQISEALQFIDGVVVAVNVDPDELQSKVSRSQRFDPKTTVPVQTRLQKRTEKSSEQPTRAEAGVASNRAASMTSTTETERSHEVIESNSVDVQAPSFTTLSEVYNTAIPKAVKVAVAIPKEYYEKIARMNGFTNTGTDQEKKNYEAEVERIRKDEEAKVTGIVTTLNPTDDPASSVNVTTYTRMAPSETTYSPSWTQTMTKLASEWGSALALILFAVWALRMLNKSMAKGPSLEVRDAAVPRIADEEEQPLEAEIEPHEPSRREQLQSLVRDDPEMAAAVLNKWIRSVK